MQGAAGHVGMKADIGVGILRAVGEPGPDGVDLTKLVGADQLFECVGLAVVAVHERLGQVQTVVVGEREQFLGFGDLGDEGLLAQHVLASAQCSPSPITMQMIGDRDVYAVDCLVVEKILVAAMDMGDVVLVSETLGVRSVA